MSQPPVAGPSTPQRPFVGPQDSIFAQFESFKQRVRDGSLAPPQVGSLRQVLANRANDIVTVAARLGKPNPLVDLPDELDPSRPTPTHAALLDPAAFAARMADAARLAASISYDPAYAAALVASVKKAPELFTPTEMGKLTRMSVADKEAAFKKNPQLKQRYDYSLAHYKRQLEAKGKIGPGAAAPHQPLASAAASPAEPGPSASASRAPSAAASPAPDRKPGAAELAPPVPAASAAPAVSAAPPAAAPPAPPAAATPAPAPASAPAPPPAPVYVEPPEQRFKRKVRDYLRESAPELAMEVGVDAILTDVVDKFLGGAVRDSVRLAAHRRAGRVDVADVAKVLDDQYGLVVPGFAAALPKRVHLEPESKRTRAVVPRKKRDE